MTRSQKQLAMSSRSRIMEIGHTHGILIWVLSANDVRGRWDIVLGRWAIWYLCPHNAIDVEINGAGARRNFLDSLADISPTVECMPIPPASSFTGITNSVMAKCILDITISTFTIVHAMQ